MNNRKRATPVKDQVSAASTISKGCVDNGNTCSETGVFKLEDDEKKIVVPVCEKYTLTIKEACISMLGQKSCVDLQRKIQIVLQFSVAISI
nr:MAG TPA: hypothetical protein [Caudoviricetes sp.]